MFQGQRLVLRTRLESDVPILHRDLYDDVVGRVRTDGAPWIPRPVTNSPFIVKPGDDRSAGVAVFTIADPDTDEPLGSTLLWGIDQHNRSAHIGLALRPVARGRGLAGETLALLSHYGFRILGLHRLGIETLTDNEPMIRAALAAGYTREGTIRQSAWVDGSMRDEATFGLLAAEWAAGSRPDGAPGSAAV